MRIHFHKFLLICLLLLEACSRIENTNNPIAMECGRNSDQLPAGSFKPVFDSDGHMLPGADLEAFFMLQDKRQDLVISEKGCVGLPQELEGSIVIRTISGKPQGTMLSVPEAWHKASFALRVVGDEDIFLSCPEAAYTDGTFLDLNAIVHGIFDPAVVQIRLHDEESTNPKGKAFFQNGRWLAPLPALAHGSHQLSMQAENLLNGFKKPVSVTCPIQVDLMPPVVSFPYPNDYSLDAVHQIWRRNPGQIIQIAREDDGFPQQIFYCLKEKSGVLDEPVCTDTDFIPVSGGFSAPDQGLWHLESFARDAAEHQSMRIKSDFLVYRETEIRAIRALLASAESDLHNGEQIKAGLQILQAEQRRRQLTQWEAAELEYAVLQASLQFLPLVKQKAILREADPQAENNNTSIAYSQDGERFLVGGERFEIIDRTGNILGELKNTLPDRMTEAGFAENDAIIWTKSAGKDIAIHTADGLLRCIIRGSMEDQPEVFARPGPLAVAVIRKDSGIGEIYDSSCLPIDVFPISKDAEYSLFFATTTDRFGIYEHHRENPDRSQFIIRDLKKGSVRTIKASNTFDARISRFASFSKDANTLALCDRSGLVLFYDLLEDSNDSTQPSAASPEYCSFNRSDSFAVATKRDFSLLRRMPDGTLLSVDSAARATLIQPKLIHDPAGNYLIEYGLLNKGQARLIFYSMSTLEKIGSLDIHSASNADRIAINPKIGTEIAISKLDREISIWNIAERWITKGPLRGVVHHGTYESPDSSFYVHQEKASELLLRSWKEAPKILTIPTGSFPNTIVPPEVIAISPDSRFVAAKISNSPRYTGVQIWERDGRALPFIQTTVAGANSMQFSPDGQSLVLVGIREAAFIRVGDPEAQEIQLSSEGSSTLITSEADALYVASEKKDWEDKRTACEIKRINANSREILLSSDVCVMEGDFYDATSQVVFGQTLAGAFVAFNLRTKEMRPLPAPHEASESLYQRDGVLVTKSIGKNRLTILRDGSAAQSIDLGFRYAQPKVLLDAKSQLWAYSDRGAIEYRRLNGDLLMSLPFPVKSLVPLHDNSNLIITVGDPGDEQQRWTLPLNIDEVTAKLKAWSLKLPKSIKTE